MNLNKCTFTDAIPLDEEGCIDESKNGEYGYRIFYEVSKEEVIASSYFRDIPDNLVSGEIQFEIDKYGNNTEETLLWTTVEEEKDSIINDEFVYFYDDISCLVTDVKERLNLT